MRGAHAALSPNFGAPAMPAPWQTMHVASYVFLPSAAPAAGVAAVALVEAAGAVAGVAAAGVAATVAGAAAAAVAATACAGQLAPALFVMNTTARLTSSSVRSLLPPLGGIALKPPMACSNASLSACATTFDHA